MCLNFRGLAIASALALVMPTTAISQTVPVICHEVKVEVLNANGQPVKNVQVEYSTPYRNSGFMNLDQAVAYRMCVNEPGPGQDPDNGLVKVRASNAKMTMSATFAFPLAGDATIVFELQP